MGPVMFIFIAVTTNLVFACVAGEIAARKGRNGLLWGGVDLVIAIVVGAFFVKFLTIDWLPIVSPFLGLIGLVVTLLLSNLRKEAALNADRAILVKAATMFLNRSPGPDETKTCHRCAELVRAPALVCRFCGHEFEISAAGT